MFDINLVNLEYNHNNYTELYSDIANELNELGFVKPSFAQGLIDREVNFPTGLETEYLNVALPHSEIEFVNKPFIYIAKNEKELPILQMGDNKEIKVQYFFVLGITEPQNQVILLQLLIELFQDKEFMVSFKNLDTNESAYLNMVNKVKTLEEKHEE